METVTTINKAALFELNRARGRLTKQQYKTLRGQILAGDHTGALRGLRKLLDRKAGAS